MLESRADGLESRADESHVEQIRTSRAEERPTPRRVALPIASAPAWGPPPSIRSRTERTRVPDKSKPLQRMSVEIARQCNLKCTYCYTEATATYAGGLSDAELRQIVDDAVAIGACLVSIVAGGESLMRRSILVDGESLIDHANSRGCYCYLYTNCTLLREDEARWLHPRDVSVVGKFNSPKDDVQDALVGVKGAAKRIRRGVDALLDAGFAAEGRLALETIICPQNYEDLPDMWRWMRRLGIIPEVEIPTIHGRAATNNASLTFDEAEAPAKYKALFEELLRIDQTEFGFTWIPHPPFPAGSCTLFESNCYVNDRGGVQPCAGVDKELGIIGRDGTIADIVTTPEFQGVRSVRRRVEEPCASCDLIDVCYGCRGASYHATGDMFAADPVCWRSHDVTPPKRVSSGCDGCSCGS